MKKGTIKTVEKFNIPQLNRVRKLRIYLPPDYEKADKRYPVLYMHDAQNIFDKKDAAFGMSMDIHELIDKMIEDGKCPEFIVVGIDNGEMRYNEYSPWQNVEIPKLLFRLKGSKNIGGEGFQYIDFIVETLKPYIDENFRTLPDRENTAISGSSMGGFISLSAGIKYQNIFSKIGVFSTAGWFHLEAIEKFIIETGKKEDIRIYMDIGTKETSNVDIKEFPEIYLSTNKRIVEALTKAGFTSSELKFDIIQNGIHNETEWKKRFPDMIMWIFGREFGN